MAFGGSAACEFVFINNLATLFYFGVFSSILIFVFSYLKITSLNSFFNKNPKFRLTRILIEKFDIFLHALKLHKSS